MISCRYITLALFAVALLPTPRTATAGHCHHCRKVIVCCNCQGHSQGRGVEEREEAEFRNRAAQPVAAPIVNSTAVFTVPMMYATMPVMPATMTTSRSAGPAAGDCCERVDRLEQEMIRLQRSMHDLQTIVQGQTDIMKILAEDLKTRRTPAAELPPAPAGSGAMLPVPAAR